MYSNKVCIDTLPCSSWRFDNGLFRQHTQ